MASFEDYVNTIKGGILKKRIRIDWLRADESLESTYTGDVLGGSLTINRNNGVRRAVTLELRLTDDLLPNIYGVWINRKFKLYLGYETKNGDYLIPQGVFVMTNPSYSARPSGATITISGTDKFSLFNSDNGGVLEDVYLINVGTNVNNSIRTLLTTFNDNSTPILGLTNSTFPFDVMMNRGAQIGDLFKKIAYFSARNIYYDEEGRFTFLDDVEDDSKGSEWDFNYGTDLYSLLSLSVENKFDKVRNVVKVIGTNVSGALPEYTAENTDSTSGTDINRIGRRVYDPIVESDIISTVSECEKLAKFILKRVKVLASEMNVTVIPLFHLDVDKVVTITEPHMKYQQKRVLINSMTIGLGVHDTMSLTVVDTDEVDFTIGNIN